MVYIAEKSKGLYKLYCAERNNIKFDSVVTTKLFHASLIFSFRELLTTLCTELISSSYALSIRCRRSSLRIVLVRKAARPSIYGT
ncbi:hypothetical protein PIROE2DRAFT_6104 [Piromyces sp. E2]|nr:hypothetical protein PIROE2DRAFT_6104 [Piromyces sp. E2]|eukprot:OUM66582.1 hypothetical protein PIROE2DRAFT_6104 [Piromyces sp. E2]